MDVVNASAAPAWVNENYFTKVLPHADKNFEKLLQLNAAAATELYKSYESITLRIQVKYENKAGNTVDRTFVLKTMLEADNVIEFIKSLGLFPKEKEIYSKILPDFEAIYARCGIAEQFGPTCFLAEETPKRITFLLEDLKALNYRHADRLNGMDMAQMTAALQKLAKFHAASVLWQKRKGNYGKQFQVGLVAERSRSFFEERSQDMIDAFRQAMQTWPGFDHQQYNSKLPTAQQYVDSLIRLSKIEENDFNVLCHGDCWNDNIMFCYNEAGEITQTRLLDFQLCKYGRPTYDLYSLIFTAAALNIKIDRFQEFLQIYHAELAKSLKLLGDGGNVPTLADIQNMMHQDRFYAFFLVIGYLPIVLMLPDAESLDERLKCGADAHNQRLLSMTNPLYAQQMCHIMPWLCVEGYMDY